MFIWFSFVQAVTFYQCINLVVANLKLENAQQMHLTFQKCTNVQALNLRVVAPENSPNTDGIHVTETQNVIIRNCVIGTGEKKLVDSKKMKQILYFVDVIFHVGWGGERNTLYKSVETFL